MPPGDYRYCACSRLHSLRGFERFYEKVIKVKADVAALRNLLSEVGGHPRSTSPLAFFIIVSSLRSQNILDLLRTKSSGKTLADATPPLPCFYPHSEWAA
jgi:hypothetical protein